MKKKSALILAIGLSLLPLFSQVAAEQKKVEREYVKTFYIDGFKIMEYFTPYVGQDSDGTQYEVYLNNKKIFTTPMCGTEIIYPGLSGLSNYDSCHFADINGDGTKEFIIEFGGGGTAGNEDVFIYALDPSGKILARFEGLDKGPFGLDDVNIDGIYEVIFNDEHFQGWHYGCSGSPAPPLVWQWHDGEYRMANFRLGKEILNTLDKIDIDTFSAQHYSEIPYNKIDHYDPANEYGYPVELLRIMLEFIYCGYQEKARELFDACWPDSVVGKEAFYKEIIDRVHSDKYWPEIEKSDW